MKMCERENCWYAHHKNQLRTKKTDPVTKEDIEIAELALKEMKREQED